MKKISNQTGQADLILLILAVVLALSTLVGCPIAP